MNILSTVATSLLLLMQQSLAQQPTTPTIINKSAVVAMDFKQLTVVDVLNKLFPGYSIDNRSTKPLESIMLSITTHEQDKALILSAITTKLDIKTIFSSNHIIIYDN